MVRRRRPRSRADRLRGTIRLGVVFAVLIGINVYVFLIRPGNVKDVARQVEASRIAAAETKAPEPPAGEENAPSVGREIAGKVGKGDALQKILRREGVAG